MRSKKSDIQILRGIAVIAVIFYHLRPLNFTNGFLGVDIFFVVSGFVLAPRIISIFHEHQSVRASLLRVKHFYIKRILRLTPPLLFMLAIIIPLTFLFASIEDHSKFASQSISSVLVMGNFGAFLFSGNYFTPNPNPLLHLWSLSAEEQIYLLFPIIILMLLVLKRQKSTDLNKALLVITMLSALFFSGILISSLDRVLDWNLKVFTDFNYYSPITRFWQFSLGYLIWSIELKNSLIKRLRLPLANPLACLLLIILLFAPISFNNFSLSLTACLLTSFILKFSSLKVTPASISKLMVFIGNRSYSIYLFHFPLIFLAKYSYFLGTPEGPRRWQTALALCLTLIFSDLSYRLLEKSKESNRELVLVRPINWVKIKYSSGIIILASFLMLMGSNTNYWGLDESIKTPPVAWDVKDTCERMSSVGGPCTYGQGNPKQVLLIGDSYAAQISETLIHIGRHLNWQVNIWTQATCQFNLNQSPNIDTNCTSRNFDIINWVKANNPDVVLLAQYVKADSNTNQLSSSIMELEKVTRELVFINNIPIFPDQQNFMKKSSLMSQIFGQRYIPPKSFPLSAMNSGDMDASKVLAKKISDWGVSSIDFTSYFCDDRKCIRFEKGKWLYWNYNHLSISGAKKISPALENFLIRN